MWTAKRSSFWFRVFGILCIDEVLSISLVLSNVIPTNVWWVREDGRAAVTSDKHLLLVLYNTKYPISPQKGHHSQAAKVLTLLFKSWATNTSHRLVRLYKTKSQNVPGSGKCEWKHEASHWVWSLYRYGCLAFVRQQAEGRNEKVVMKMVCSVPEYTLNLVVLIGPDNSLVTWVRSRLKPRGMAWVGDHGVCRSAESKAMGCGWYHLEPMVMPNHDFADPRSWVNLTLVW